MEDSRRIKEQKVYVASEFLKDYEQFRAGLTKHTSYELPDRTVIDLGEEVIQAGEILFKPSMIGKFEPGVHEMAAECLAKVEVELKKELFGCIILCGGNTLIGNYANRLNRELITNSPNNMKVKLLASPDRQNLAWTGGSIISSLNTFQSMWITHVDYEENGPSIVHRKCLQ